MFGIQNLNDDVRIDIRDIRPGDIIAAVGTNGYPSIIIGSVDLIADDTVYFMDDLYSTQDDRFYFISRPTSDGQIFYEAWYGPNDTRRWDDASEDVKGFWEKRAAVAKRVFCE